MVVEEGMHRLILESGHSKAMLSTIGGIAFTLLGLAVILYVINVYWWVFVFFIPVLVMTFWLFFRSQNPLKIESINGLVEISSKGKKVWGGSLKDIDRIGVQQGRMRLLVLYFKGGDSFSFLIPFLRDDQISEFQSWLSVHDCK